MQQENDVRVALFALDQGKYDMEQSLQELEALAQANHMECVAQLVQKRDTPETGTYFGEGKLAEGKLLCMNLQVECVIFDAELSGSQIRNLEELLECEVIDRTMLILEIFKNRAITNEGKLQTELASLRYRLPRLAGLGASLSRQGGGGTGAGGARRGAGESKLEYDKRHIRRRISALEERLTEIELRRAQTRKSRKKKGVPVIALVGYTNVGKSSLLNRLCDAEVFAQNMLFATLDPTARRLVLPSGLETVVIDTVGFVSRLPHGLVRAFQSTLEEAAFADIIIKVCDASDENASEQLAVTEQVLQELGCGEIPRVTVYNKCDVTNQFDNSAAMGIALSAKTGQGIDTLLSRLDEMLCERVRCIKVCFPYDQLHYATPLRERGVVQSQEYQEQGLVMTGIVKMEDYHLFEPFFI